MLKRSLALLWLLSVLTSCGSMAPKRSADKSSVARYRAAMTSFVVGDQALADVTGDGLLDLVLYWHNHHVYVYASNGSRFLNKGQWTKTKVPPGSALSFADVTGDGRADLLMTYFHNDDAYHATVQVRRSSGIDFMSTELWWEGWGYSGWWEFYFADMNSDRKADLIAHPNTEAGLRVGLSTSWLFQSLQHWGPSDYLDINGEPGGADVTFFTDATNDQRADMIVHGDFGIVVRPSTGAALGADEGWATTPFFSPNATWSADVDGDGRADQVLKNSNGVYVRRAANGSYLPSEPWASPFTGSVLVGDVTNDRRADLVQPIIQSHKECYSTGCIMVIDRVTVFVRASLGSTFAGPVSWYAGG